MRAERERQNFRSQLKNIYVTPYPRSVRSPLHDLPLPLQPNFFTPAHRTAPAHHIFGPLRSSSAPAPIFFKQQTEKWTDFYRASSYASALLAVVILYVGLFVRLSVCLPHACFVTKPNNTLRIFWYHTKGQLPYFSDTYNDCYSYVGVAPYVSNLCSNRLSPSIRADFDRFLLITSQPYKRYQKQFNCDE